MSAWIFFVIVAGLFVTGIFAFHLLFRCFLKQYDLQEISSCIKPHLAFAGLVLLLIGAGMGSAVFVSFEENELFGFGTKSLVIAFIAACLWSVGENMGLSGWKRALFLYGLCLIGVFGMPVADTFLFMSVPAPVVCLLGALFWMIFVLAFQRLDKIPGFSINGALSFFIFTVFLSFFFAQMPFLFGLASVALFVLSISTNAFFNQPATQVFRRLPCAPIGFLWGFFLTYEAVNGAAFGAIITTGYYIFEFVQAMCWSIWRTHRVSPLSSPFLTELVVKENASDSQISRFIAMRSALFGALGIIATIAGGIIGWWEYSVFFIIIFVDMYRRLSDWNAPQVRLRDLFTDLKSGVRELGSEFKKLSLKNEIEQSDKVKKEHKKSIQMRPVKAQVSLQDSFALPLVSKQTVGRLKAAGAANKPRGQSIKKQQKRINRTQAKKSTLSKIQKKTTKRLQKKNIKKTSLSKGVSRRKA